MSKASAQHTPQDPIDAADSAVMHTKLVESMHYSHLGKKFFRFGFVLAGALAFAIGAQAESPTQSSDRAASSQVQKLPVHPKQSEEECSANNGVWKRTYPYSPMRPNTPNDFSCELPNPKAGMLCTSSSECGRTSCIPQSDKAGTVVEGRCSSFSSGYGCQVTLENGVVKSICSD